MKKKKRIALALAAALMMVLLLAACSNKTIRLGVAGIGGVYQVFGEDYAALQAQFFCYFAEKCFLCSRN